ncbi:hypothetical protein F511_25485 [Dorcoceras hygrometricum]|uniref:Uncharacterized protein n=1 Tax=Dorcoceras hygrometricum TaxID=472368 RepID=A0A2Z7D6N5_9LAMI|nr:hypothetical protein F511_25485 [Dorcoceras hygrometricum]
MNSDSGGGDEGDGRWCDDGRRRREGGGGELKGRVVNTTCHAFILRPTILNKLNINFVRKLRNQYLCNPQWFKDTASRITDSTCKNQLIMVSAQYGPFSSNIPIESTTIGKSRVARDWIAMHTSWRSNSDIACATREYEGAEDSEEHLSRFENAVILHQYSDPIKSQVFLTILVMSTYSGSSEGGPRNPKSEKLYEFHRDYDYMIMECCQ